MSAPDKLPWMCANVNCENPKLSGSQHCMSCIMGAQKAFREMFKGVNLKKKKPLKRTAVRKVSDKRKEELKEYKPMRLKYISDHPNCEMRLPGCTGKTETIHHKSISALDFLNVETWLGGCLHCHITLEQLPATERRELAFLVDVKERKTI